MNFHIISTGSKGNAYTITDDQGRIIALDAGVGPKDFLQAVYHDISKIDGVLVTHEHQDHCKAAERLSFLGIPVYMSEGTAQSIRGSGNFYSCNYLPLMPDSQNFDVFKAGSWLIQPFSVQHDAADPVGYLMANTKGHKILYATDTFYIRYKFHRITHLIIEANYCTDILMQRIEAGKISNSRKDRLLHSHFSLENLLKWLKVTDLTHCVKIVLVHLSDDNSDEAKMVDAVEKQTGIETVAAADGMDINFDLFPF